MVGLPLVDFLFHYLWWNFLRLCKHYAHSSFDFLLPEKNFSLVFPYFNREIQNRLGDVGVVVHRNTISNRLREEGLYARRPRKLPLLTKKHVSARLAYAREHRNKPFKYFQRLAIVHLNLYLLEFYLAFF